MSKIDLSVAIIFKNEIRCLERCLKSLQPLRERLSVQIVMADTGSTDGSRAVAERYADILFDFPWINDFAAARNAVLERCTGSWVLVIDCDEWLDEDVHELVLFLTARKAETKDYCGAGILVRNYSNASHDRYMDILLQRLLRMEGKPHYEGAIHERAVFCSERKGFAQLKRTILHHDGYVMLNDGSEEGKAKRSRNMVLLSAELAANPDDLCKNLQYLESSGEDEEYYSVLRHAVTLVAERKGEWKRFGAAILRRAAFDAYNNHLSELNKWLNLSSAMFPASYYTQIDVGFIKFVCAIVEGEYAEAIAFGEAFLRARADFRSDPDAYAKTSVSFLQKNDGYSEMYVKLRMAEAYFTMGHSESSMKLLTETDWTLLDARHTEYFVSILQALSQNGVDVGPLLSACWAGIQQPVPSPERAQERVEAFQKLVSVEPVQETQGESDELARLAAKVKAILDKLPPDDPIAVELKSSDAYRKVAHLIEG